MGSPGAFSAALFPAGLDSASLVLSVAGQRFLAFLNHILLMAVREAQGREARPAPARFTTLRIDITSKILKGALMMGDGDLAYQGTQMAVGNQSKFNWTDYGDMA